MAAATDQAGPTPTVLVRRAVEALATLFFEPLAVAEPLRDAWEGATAALARVGVAAVPVPPAYPPDADAAYALHERAFPDLERLADSSFGPEGLAEAALDELLARRGDGHTFLHARRRSSGPWEFDRSSPAGWSIRSFGLALTDTPPLSVADVEPRGPAQRAGLRRGQVVVAINGRPATHLRRFRAGALLDYGDDVTNVLVVRDAHGETKEVTLRPELLPMPVTTLLPGPIGLLRMDGFASNARETEAVSAALTAFEQAGALGWIIDVRRNGGGKSIDVSRLFVQQGRLISRQRHNEVELPDGTVLPRPQDIDFDGSALPFQRPLVVLIGPGSLSGAESFAGPLRAYGRAVLVGERTAGLCGAARSVELAPGWGMTLAAYETVFGPQEGRLNRIGVAADIVVAPTPDDEAAGRDPQLEAALAVLRRQAV